MGNVSSVIKDIWHLAILVILVKNYFYSFFAVYFSFLQLVQSVTQYPCLIEVLGSAMMLCFAGYYIIMVRKNIDVNFKRNMSLDKYKITRHFTL